MNKDQILDAVTKKFETDDGKLVDVIYGTSDGQLFFSPEEAAKAADVIADKVITPYFRDEKVREMAKRNLKLTLMVFATDFVKRTKLYKMKPTYSEFQKYASDMGVKPVDNVAFDFIVSKVFASRRPVSPGQKDTIYMFEKGIVNAVFMRRYPKGQVWMYGDNLVLTCPTNTELVSGTFNHIFAPLL